MTDTQTTAPAPVILCVDDEPNILSALRRLFRSHGFQVLLAEGGAQGLALLDTEQVDLVISDMRMPGMDGVAFLEQVRARKPDLLRLLLTGYADIGSIMGAINRGEIYRYIPKPWNDHDMVMVVRDALQRSALEQDKKRLEAVVLAQNEELKRINTGLEATVAQRTAELRNANSSLQGANERLKNSFLTSIKMFTGLMELRDTKLAGYSRRVAELARRLALGMKLDQRQAQEVFVAGLLHAIGKVGFDDELLRTPVALMTPRQMEFFRKHPQRAEQLLMPFSELKSAIEMVAEQLEHYDGSGYPLGRSGRNIPVGARILAVASGYVSMQTGLWHAQALDREQTVQVMQQLSAKAYDPQIVGILLELPQIDEVNTAAGPGTISITVSSRELQVGMVLSQDLISPSGVLLLTGGRQLDEALIHKIVAFERSSHSRLQMQVQHTAYAP